MSSSGSVKQLLKQANERYFAVFRMCMRLHREKLPDDLRGLGDSYVRKEFRRTMVGSTTPEQMEMLKKNLENISGAYMSPGSGCVGKKHSVGYVEFLFGCLS